MDDVSLASEAHHYSPDVCFWHEADIQAREAHVDF